MIHNSNDSALPIAGIIGYKLNRLTELLGHQLDAQNPRGSNDNIAFICFLLTLSAYNSPFLKCGRLIHCSLWLRLHDDESKTTRLCHRHPHVKGIRRFREYSLWPEFSNISVLGRMRVAEPPKTDRNINVSQISVLVWTQP